MVFFFAHQGLIKALAIEEYGSHIFHFGNLLHVKSGHIVHGCNAQGVMGSGVALGVKQTWPHVFESYRREYETNGLMLGKAYPVPAVPSLLVWNAVTQNLYGTGQRLTNYEAVACCFEQVNSWITKNEEAVDERSLVLRVQGTPAEVHIPLIGAARGGGNWRVIEAIIEETMDFPVTLWLPDATVTTR